MPVITISRLTGSGGSTIGQRLAERIGADYLNTQIIHEVAHRLGISEASASAYNERAEPFIDRLARVLWVATPGLAPVGGVIADLPYPSTSQAFVDITEQIVRQAAQHGNVVIFGHGAQFILANQPGVLHVRFIAPLAVRVARVMKRDGLSHAAAERRVHDEDHRRAESIRQFYHADWHAPDPFHLILNTALLDQEACMGLIVQAAADEQRRAGGKAAP
jgi:cytidylate kinase